MKTFAFKVKAATFEMFRLQCRGSDFIFKAARQRVFADQHEKLQTTTPTHFTHEKAGNLQELLLTSPGIQICPQQPVIVSHTKGQTALQQRVHDITWRTLINPNFVSRKQRICWALWSSYSGHLWLNYFESHQIA